ncbi:uncharacterized protein BT62DRAFT_1078160 [Guyanagaster necrorhizus]|uniref:Uncharacterized protein n=1 Tax=Guyanagaster necrorhizus TaxID=856835 RepID=A0A9P7VQ73_9AGAR|nr:uncharacterized protein BT62DRAFT_1078160 [Guyanagaster necrorhizus MCA 3950]KAG7443999.1 hypothetical protein BT62DRAFT_1078160 [Guyanagaster necrorhizus MCA 3950]
MRVRHGIHTWNGSIRTIDVYRRLLHKLHLLERLALILIVYHTYLLLGRALTQWKYTCVNDVDNLGFSRAPAEKIKGTAVICGGSDEAKRVDSWNQKNIRSCVMQCDSLQGVQVFVYRGCCKLFRGFESKCKALDINVCPEYDGDLPKTVFVSRRGLETLICRLVLSDRYENIKQITGTATGVSSSCFNSQYLDQVTIRTGRGIRTVQASMVTRVSDIPGPISQAADPTSFSDCTGPACAGIKWLRREGFGIAAEYPRRKLPLDELKIAYDQKIHYSTLHFHVPKENCTTDYTVDHRSIYTQRVEGNFIKVYCGAWGDMDPPQTVGSQALYEIASAFVSHAAPITYTRFEYAVNLPSNWVAIGDSVTRVNPVFGQSCTKALLGAVCLNTMLVGVKTTVALPQNFSKMFFETQGAKIAPLWTDVKAEDYGYETTIPVPESTYQRGNSPGDILGGSTSSHSRTSRPLGLVLKIAWNSLEIIGLDRYEYSVILVAEDWVK